jgi:P3 major capsid protein
MSTSANQLTPAQINGLARAAIKAKAVKMEQLIFSSTYTASGTTNISNTQPVVNVIPRNVGLILGFWVNISATITNGSGVQIDRSDFNASNLLTQIQFNDLNNNTRIQTTGWHMGFINSMKARRPFGTALVYATGFDDPIKYGSNFGSAYLNGEIAAPATIAASGGTGTVNMWYWVPLAYSESDYRGAVYANVVNATMQLNLTFNPVPVVANGTDSTSAIYYGDAGGSVALARISAATVIVYQVYLDQLPTGANNAVLLPILDLSTIYEFKQTVFSAITVGQDFPMQYANFRDFLSTVMVFVNTGATGARTGGTDVNYLALQSANFTNIWKKTPDLVALQTRNHLQTDLPVGTYYFGSREKPISTVQYGNMQIILNASTAGAGAYVLMGYEDFALVQTLSMAGSLAAS